MPATLLSEARNMFCAVREARTRAEADRDRRVLLGFTAVDAEMSAAVAAEVKILKAAKLQAAEKRAGKQAATEQMPTDAPTEVVAKEEDQVTSPTLEQQGSDEVKRRTKGSCGIMKPGCERTPRRFIHSWYLAAKQSTVDDDDDNKDVELRLSGEFAKLTDGENAYKGSRAKKDKTDPRRRKGVTDEDAQGQWTEAMLSLYEYGYVEVGHAGAGRKKVQEAQENLATQLTPLARELISFSMQLAELAQRDGLVERSKVSSAALSAHLKRGIDHLALLLDSETQQIKESASTTLGVMVRCNSAFKSIIAEDQRIVSALTKLMNEGVLEAVSAVELLLAGNEAACNQARQAGVCRRCKHTNPNPRSLHLTRNTLLIIPDVSPREHCDARDVSRQAISILAAFISIDE